MAEVLYAEMYVSLLLFRNLQERTFDFSGRQPLLVSKGVQKRLIAPSDFSALCSYVIYILMDRRYHCCLKSRRNWKRPFFKYRNHIEKCLWFCNIKKRKSLSHPFWPITHKDHYSNFWLAYTFSGKKLMLHTGLQRLI